MLIFIQHTRTLFHWAISNLPGKVKVAQLACHPLLSLPIISVALCCELLDKGGIGSLWSVLLVLISRRQQIPLTGIMSVSKISMLLCLHVLRDLFNTLFIRDKPLANSNTQDICTSDDGHTWHSQWLKHPALVHFPLSLVINTYCINVHTHGSKNVSRVLAVELKQISFFCVCVPGLSSHGRRVLWVWQNWRGLRRGRVLSQEWRRGHCSDVERRAAFSCGACRTQTVGSYSLSKAILQAIPSSFPCHFALYAFALQKHLSSKNTSDNNNLIMSPTRYIAVFLLHRQTFYSLLNSDVRRTL